MEDRIKFQDICQKIKKSTPDNNLLKGDQQFITELFRVLENEVTRGNAWLKEPEHGIIPVLDRDILECKGFAKPYGKQSSIYCVDIEKAKDYASVIRNEFPFIAKTNEESTVFDRVPVPRLPKQKTLPKHKSPHKHKTYQTEDYKPLVNPHQWSPSPNVKKAVAELKNSSTAPELSRILGNILEATSQSAPTYNKLTTELFEILQIALGAEKSDLDAVNKILSDIQYASSRFGSLNDLFGDKGKVWVIDHAEKIKQLEVIMARLFVQKADSEEKKTGKRPVSTPISTHEISVEMLLSEFSVEGVQSFLEEKLNASVKSKQLPIDFAQSLNERVYEEVKVRLSNEIRACINASYGSGKLDAHQGLWVIRLFDKAIEMVELALKRHNTPKIAAGEFLKTPLRWMMSIFCVFLVFAQIYAVIVAPFGNKPLEPRVPVASEVYQDSLQNALKEMGRYARENTKFLSDKDKPLNIISFKDHLEETLENVERHERDLKGIAMRTLDRAIWDLESVSTDRRMAYLEGDTQTLKEKSDKLDSQLKQIEGLSDRLEEASQNIKPGSRVALGFEKLIEESPRARSYGIAAMSEYERVLIDSIAATDGQEIADICKDAIYQWTLPELRDTTMTEQVCTDLATTVSDYKSSVQTLKSELVSKIPDANKLHRDLTEFGSYYDRYKATVDSIERDVTRAEILLADTEGSFEYARNMTLLNEHKRAWSSALNALFDPLQIRVVSFSDPESGSRMELKDAALIGCRNAIAYGDFERGIEEHLVDVWLSSTFENDTMAGAIFRSSAPYGVFRGLEEIARTTIEGIEYAWRRDKGRSPWLFDIGGILISNILQWCSVLGLFGVVKTALLSTGVSFDRISSWCSDKLAEIQRLERGSQESFSMISRLPFSEKILRVFFKGSNFGSWVFKGMYSGLDKLTMKRNAQDTHFLAYITPLIPLFCIGMAGIQYVIANTVDKSASIISNMDNPLFDTPDAIKDAVVAWNLWKQLQSIVETFHSDVYGGYVTFSLGMSAVTRAWGMLRDCLAPRESQTILISGGTPLQLQNSPNSQQLVPLKDETAIILSSTQRPIQGGTGFKASAHSLLYQIANVHTAIYRGFMRGLVYFFGPRGQSIDSIDLGDLSPDKIAQYGLLKHHLVASSANILAMFCLHYTLGSLSANNSPAHGFERAAADSLKKGTPLSGDWIGNRILRPGEARLFEMNEGTRQTCEKFFNSFLKESSVTSGDFMADIVNDPRKLQTYMQLSGQFPEIKEKIGQALSDVKTLPVDPNEVARLIDSLLDFKSSVKRFFLTGEIDVRTLPK